MVIFSYWHPLFTRFMEFIEKQGNFTPLKIAKAADHAKKPATSDPDKKWELSVDRGKMQSL